MNTFLKREASNVLQKQIHHLPYPVDQHLCLDNFLVKLGENNLFSICIRDLPAKKVCFHNAICGKFWGFTQGSMEGMTVREILTGVPNFINVEQELANIEKYEQTAIENRRASVFQQVLLSYDGFVQVRQSQITPLIGISNRLITIASIGVDVTRYTNRLKLLDFYRYYYPKRADTVARFFRHYQLDTYFYQPLSYEELRTMLTMLREYRHKHIAESLGVSPKTVANYLSSIRDKLKSYYEIYTVLQALRIQPAWELKGF